jgi:hypothetical protein
MLILKLDNFLECALEQVFENEGKQMEIID